MDLEEAAEGGDVLAFIGEDDAGAFGHVHGRAAADRHDGVAVGPLHLEVAGVGRVEARLPAREDVKGRLDALFLQSIEERGVGPRAMDRVGKDEKGADVAAAAQFVDEAEGTPRPFDEAVLRIADEAREDPKDPLVAPGISRIKEKHIAMVLFFNILQQRSDEAEKDP